MEVTKFILIYNNFSDSYKQQIKDIMFFICMNEEQQDTLVECFFVLVCYNKRKVTTAQIQHNKTVGQNKTKKAKVYLNIVFACS